MGKDQAPAFANGWKLGLMLCFDCAFHPPTLAPIYILTVCPQWTHIMSLLLVPVPQDNLNLRPSPSYSTSLLFQHDSDQRARITDEESQPNHDARDHRRRNRFCSLTISRVLAWFIIPLNAPASNAVYSITTQGPRLCFLGLDFIASYNQQNDWMQRRGPVGPGTDSLNDLISASLGMIDIGFSSKFNEVTHVYSSHSTSHSTSCP
jgi:hypothetical protein